MNCNENIDMHLALSPFPTTNLTHLLKVYKNYMYLVSCLQRKWAVQFGLEIISGLEIC